MMSVFAQWLRRYPEVFDRLNRINRHWRRPSSIYGELAKHMPDRPFTFLQIGANDGISNDPYREFMIQPEARGCAVEPVPEFYRAMCRNYISYPNVLPENCAIGYPAGRLPFYAYNAAFLKSKRDSKELAGLASFTRQKLLVPLSATELPDECIQEIIIPVNTVEDLMVKHGFDCFDCLFIDCEGYEENILTNINYKMVKPRLIVFEHTHLAESGKAVESHLAEWGFHFKRLTYDTIATLG